MADRSQPSGEAQVVGSPQYIIIRSNNLGELTGRKSQRLRRFGDDRMRSNHGIQTAGCDHSKARVGWGDRQSISAAKGRQPVRIGDAALVDGEANTQAQQGRCAIVGAVAVYVALGT